MVPEAARDLRAGGGDPGRVRVAELHLRSGERDTVLHQVAQEQRRVLQVPAGGQAARAEVRPGRHSPGRE